MSFVLDASVTASWFFPDEENADASEAWRRSATEDVMVPLHWWFEVRNAMLTAERRGRISERLTSIALSRLSRLPITTASRPDEADVFALARKHCLTFSDAVYLELAQQRNMPLATLDDHLAAAANIEGVGVIGSQT